MVNHKLLIRHGFIKDSKIKSKYNELIKGKPLSEADNAKREEWNHYVDELDESKLEGKAAEEFDETAKDTWEYTGYPPSINKYRVVYSRYNLSIEAVYYHILDWMKYTTGFAKIHKVTDIFAVSEQSAFFGASQQRLGLQQDKVTQFLATIGKMIKDVFQIVRELRVIDERLSLYYATDPKKGKVHGSIQESAEISLKGIWIDLVEQGAKNPASVYGMARELQFTTLPDLFFKYHPQNAAEIEHMIENLDFNRKVKEVLKRKLRTFIEWKKFTFDELKSKRLFTLKYLRQHYDVIEMYMAWVKPYLRHIKRLHVADKTDDSELINAFSGSIVEIEVLGSKLPTIVQQGKRIGANKKVHSVMCAYFFYRTRALMNFNDEYHKGPVHAGKLDMELRCYSWTKEQLQSYIEMKRDENMDLLKEVDESIKEALDAMGGELKRYLIEAEKRIYNKKKYTPPPPKQSMLDPLLAIFNLDGWFSNNKKDPDALTYMEKLAEVKNSDSTGQQDLYVIYKEFKKAYKMVSW